MTARGPTVLTPGGVATDMTRPTVTLPSGDGYPVVGLGTGNGGGETVTAATDADLDRERDDEDDRRIDGSSR